MARYVWFLKESFFFISNWLLYFVSNVFLDTTSKVKACFSTLNKTTRANQRVLITIETLCKQFVNLKNTIYRCYGLGDVRAVY